MSSTYDNSNDDGTISSMTYFDENVMWMLLWISTMLLFICLPFYSSRRRKICMRGIRERRWISDDEDLFDDDGNDRSAGPDQQERRQQIQENRRRFRTNRTQEDEIRQQYLLHLMENYSMVRTFYADCKISSVQVLYEFKHTAFFCSLFKSIVSYLIFTHHFFFIVAKCFIS
jgi:hypothetical protein